MHPRFSLAGAVIIAATTHAAESQSAEAAVRRRQKTGQRDPHVDRWRLLAWIGRTAALLGAFLVSFYAATFALSLGDRPACTRDGSVVTCLRTPFTD